MRCNRKIYAHWCYIDNCGDALNPYLLGKLSGCKVIYCNNTLPRYTTELKRVIKQIIQKKKIDINRFIPPFFWRKKKIVLAIGSILNRSLPNYQVWGAGYLNGFEHAKGGTLYAVRGEYSAQKLYSEGFPLCTVYGDPALLLPLVYQPKAKIECEIGLIPHFLEYSDYKNRYPNSNIINITCTDIEKVVEQICSCRYILSSSLHGIIIAHAYGIPALWIKKGYIGTDDIKFYDYFSSVGINPFYAGQININVDQLLSIQYNSLPVELKKIMLPKVNLAEIQKRLLAVCPFKIVESVKKVLI